MLRFKTKQLEIYAGRLGFTVEALQRCLEAPTLERANVDLSLFKQSIKRTYRQLSLELHPDRNPDCPEKAEQFKELSLAYSDVSKFLECVSVQQAPQVQVVQVRPIVRVTVTNCNTKTACNSTSFTSNWWTHTV